jgi:heptosyltransferase-3
MQFLLIKLNHLGDTLMLTPTLRFLRERWPEAHVDVVVRESCEAMLAGNPDVSRVLTVAAPEKGHRSLGRSVRSLARTLPALFARRYDYAFDLSNSDRAKFWIQMTRAKVRGANQSYGVLRWKRVLFNRFSSFEWGPEHQVLKDFRTVTDILGVQAEPGPLRFTAAPAAALERKLGALPEPGRCVVLHPTSRWAFKQWRPERWAAVADEVARCHGVDVIFSCGPAEVERAHVAAILAACRARHRFTEGRLALPELAALLARARFYLGVDTVVMHLAAAMQTPVVALFGPSQELSWHPWQCRHELVLGNCPCKVRYNHCRVVTAKSDPYPCMEGIGVEAVLERVAALLAAPER